MIGSCPDVADPTKPDGTFVAFVGPEIPVVEPGAGRLFKGRSVAAKVEVERVSLAGIPVCVGTSVWLAVDDTAVLMSSKDGRGKSTAGADVVNAPFVFESSIKAVESACETWDGSKLETSEDSGSWPVPVTLGVGSPVWFGTRSDSVEISDGRVKDSEAGMPPFEVIRVGTLTLDGMPVGMGIAVSDEGSSWIEVEPRIELLSGVVMVGSMTEAVEPPETTGNNPSPVLDGVACASDIEEVGCMLLLEANTVVGAVVPGTSIPVCDAGRTSPVDVGTAGPSEVGLGLGIARAEAEDVLTTGA
jgi:hypothetical protein